MFDKGPLSPIRWYFRKGMIKSSQICCVMKFVWRSHVTLPLPIIPMQIISLQFSYCCHVYKSISCQLDISLWISIIFLRMKTISLWLTDCCNVFAQDRYARGNILSCGIALPWHCCCCSAVPLRRTCTCLKTCTWYLHFGTLGPTWYQLVPLPLLLFYLRRWQTGWRCHAKTKTLFTVFSVFGIQLAFQFDLLNCW